MDDTEDNEIMISDDQNNVPHECGMSTCQTKGGMAVILSGRRIVSAAPISEAGY